MEKIFVKFISGEHAGKTGYFYKEEVTRPMAAFNVVKVYVDGEAVKVSRKWIEEV